jgi:nitronate monooxygenase
MIDKIGIEYPIIQAPMAGGPSTPELVAAVSNAGGLGSLGAGYLMSEMLDSEIKKIKQITGKPFNINLFIPESAKPRNPSQNVMNKLEEFSKELDCDAPRLSEFPQSGFNDQLSAIIDNKVRVFSFTFGIPEEKVMKKLREERIFIIGTATCVEEGILLERAGCDAIVAQGSEAGGHRGSFAKGDRVPLIGGLALIPQLVDEVKIPVIASGGIMDGRGIAAALALGASAVQIGTAFLCTEEAGVPKPYRNKLLNSKDISTVLTKSFSGKYARGIRNRFIDEMSSLEGGVASYPLQNSFTRSIRNAAKEKGDPEFMSLWAGQGSSMSRKFTAGELLNTLVTETNEALKRIGRNL